MRDLLKPYVGKYVLCKGWITEWEYFNDKHSARLLISKPIIKRPNKNVLFDNQELISKEHHINLFLPTKGLEDSKIPYEKYQCVSFAGYINQYRRKNGSVDYGVYPTAYSQLEQELEQLIKLLRRMFKEFKEFSAEILYIVEEHLKPAIQSIMIELEEAGDMLPTFYHNYQHYKEELKIWRSCLDKYAKRTRCVHSNRRLRRQYKIKEN